MIHRNIKSGKNDNVTVIELGRGDVKIQNVQYPSTEQQSGFIAISFTNDVPHEIGFDHKDGGVVPLDKWNPDVLISFFKLESLEVLQDQLNIAREQLTLILKPSVLIDVSI